MAVRILIADDHGILRAGLRALLATEPGLEVVGEAETGELALQVATECRPDVVLVDVSMPGAGGLEAVRRLRERLPDARALVLTMHEEESLLREAIRAGACGYIVKRAVESELIGAIHAVLRGELYVHPAMTRALLRDHSEQETRSLPGNAVLTRREEGVVGLLVRGCTNRQIAEDLGISVDTAGALRARILGKLGLKNRVELLRWAGRRRPVG